MSNDGPRTLTMTGADLAERILANADDEWDGVSDPVELAVSYVRALEKRCVTLHALAREMLGTFTKTSDGHRARVGQVQIARWEKRLGDGDG